MVRTRSDGVAQAGYQAWSGARVARLAFLIGLGRSSQEIAADPLVATTPAAVRRQTRRLGLAFRAAESARLPHAVLCRYDAAAARRGLDREALIHRILLNAGSDDDLIDNILDDDG